MTNQYSTKQKRTLMFRENIVTGNKCKIVNPNVINRNIKPFIEAEIININDDIITIKYIVNFLNGRLLYDEMKIPLNEIYPYE